MAERESHGRAGEPRQSERATPQARQTGRLTHKERDAAAYKPPNTTDHTMEQDGAHHGTEHTKGTTGRTMKRNGAAGEATARTGRTRWRKRERQGIVEYKGFRREIH